MQAFVVIELPLWAEKYEKCVRETPILDLPARMSVAVELSRRNVVQGTGGPFGAAIFDMDSGELIAVGVNVVVPQHCSIAHAEMVAFMIAQRRAESFDLSALGRMQLVTSCEPCAMCLGAIPWTGIASVVCGARAEDAEEIGFNEGNKPICWATYLERNGIEVTLDVGRESARQVLQLYQESGATIYNSRKGA